MVPRENKNNANVKFGGQTMSIMVFSEIAYGAWIPHLYLRRGELVNQCLMSNN